MPPRTRALLVQETSTDEEEGSVYETSSFSPSDDDDDSSSSSSSTSPRNGKRTTRNKRRKTRKLNDEDEEEDACGILRKVSTSPSARGELLVVNPPLDKLKSDHENRPLWVTPSGIIYLERLHQYYEQAQSFLSSVAEPRKRTEFIQEWELTAVALQAASSIEMSSEEIVEDLEVFSKVKLDPGVRRFILDNTKNYGKVKLVWREGKRYVESTRTDLLKTLYRNKVIAGYLVEDDDHPNEQESETTDAADAPDANVLANAPTPESFVRWLYANEKKTDNDTSGTTTTPRDDSEEEKSNATSYDFRISKEAYEQVKREALRIGIPLVEEFDYRNQTASSSAPSPPSGDEASTSPPPINAPGELDCTLKPFTRIRPYQENALKKMFGNGRAKSGVFVLPCGSGKTLTGIIAMCTMRKAAVIMCNNTVSVEQWKREIHHFADVPSSLVCRYTSKLKDPLPPPSAPAFILLSTYNMLSLDPVRAKSQASRDAAAEFAAREWGLLVLDEVHVAPANVFRKVVSRLRVRCKLGLTATLVREDGLIDDLSFLVGPKLFEANWMDLTDQGFLAKVVCQEVRCEMTREFMAEYLKRGGNAAVEAETEEEEENKKKTPARRPSPAQHHLCSLLLAMNPNKFKTCEYLIRMHEARGDKVLVFCDNVRAIEWYAKTLQRPLIYGATPERRRVELLASFQSSRSVNTLFMSKVGDLAIDIPEATVVIQISSLYGSRRQEAQRLGRVLRPKPPSTAAGERGFDAFFYTLVVPDTREAVYARRRQRYLADNGYYYRVVENLLRDSEFQSAHMKTVEESKELLVTLILGEEERAEIRAKDKRERMVEDNVSSTTPPEVHDQHQTVTAATINVAALSAGGTSLAYDEYDE